MFTFKDYLKEELRLEDEELSQDFNCLMMDEIKYLIEEQDETLDYSVARGQHYSSMARRGEFYDFYNT